MSTSHRPGEVESLPGVRLRIRGVEGGVITAEQLGLFLFDFSVAFELSRGRLEGGDSTGRLTKWHLYRGYKRVPPEERLVIERFRMESPVEVLAATIATTSLGVGGIWAAIQAIEKLYMLPLNRRKTQLEMAKLELEVQRLEQERSRERKYDTFASTRMTDASRRQFQEPRIYDLDETERITATVERRLLRSPVQVGDVDIEFVDRIRPPGGQSK